MAHNKVMEQKIADGEVIEVDNGALIVVEKLHQGPFDARLVVDKGNGERLGVDLRAKEMPPAFSRVERDGRPREIQRARVKHREKMRNGGTHLRRCL